MHIKIIQFGEGDKSVFLVVDAETESPLFEVKIYNPLQGYAFNTLTDIFRRILAEWKKENRND